MSQALEKVQKKEVTPDLAAMHSQFSSFVDVVKVKAHNNVILDEDENISGKDVDKHFIDNVDIHKVVDDTEGEEEVINDIVVSIEGVQKVVHGVAETVGEDKPTTSAPRDSVLVNKLLFASTCTGKYHLPYKIRLNYQVQQDHGRKC